MFVNKYCFFMCPEKLVLALHLCPNELLFNALHYTGLNSQATNTKITITHTYMILSILPDLYC